MQHRVYIYALDKETYSLVNYHYLVENLITIQNIVYFAQTLKNACDDNVMIWVVDGTRDLRELARPMLKNPTPEETVCFKMYLEQYGMYFS